MSNEYSTTVFVYRNKATGQIKALFLQEAMSMYQQAGYEHVDTIEPRTWIELHYEEIMKNASA